MTADMVQANGATFEKIRERLGEESGTKSDLSVQKLAKALGVSRTTMTNLLEGRMVAFGTLTTRVMPALKLRWPEGVWPSFTLMDLIYEDSGTRFPRDPREFPLKPGAPAFGYYLTHNRKSLGSVDWAWEVFTVERVRAEKLAGQFSLTGKSTDHEGYVYSYTLERLDIHLCVMHATDVTGRRAWNSYAGIFTHIIDGTLCGVWSGFDLTWRPTTYRYVISPEELTPKRLKSICSAAGQAFFPSA